MKWLLVLLTLVLLGLASPPSRGVRQQSARGLRLGVYDSRALAVAYVRSDLNTKRLGELEARRAKAESRGDRKEVAAIEAEGQRLQRRFHLQGFSAAPIDDILAHIRQDIPAIAETAGVDAIVNRWSLVHHRESVEIVDLTEAMVAPFHPDAQTLALIRDLKATQPLDLDQAEEED